MTLSNQNSVLRYPLTGHLSGSSLTTPGGHAYLTSLSEVYIRNTDGKVFSLTDTGIGERMNIYRLGSYYYEVHMLDGAAGYEVLQAKDINIKMFRSGNSIDNIRQTGEGVSFTVSSSQDPSIVGGGNLSIDAAVFNALEITLSTTDSTVAQIYLAAGENTGNL